MRSFVYCLPALCFMTATAIGATDDPIKEVEGWSIFENETNCSAVAIFEDREVLLLSYDASDRTTRITFTDVDATSLTKGDTRQLDILLQLSNGVLDEGWSEIEFTVTVNDDGNRMFISQRLNEPALSDLKKSTAIAFDYKGRRIGAYNLKGTASALTEVESCSQKVHNINPNDVFAGED